MTRLFRPPTLAPVALLVVAGWMVAGAVIVASTLLGWPSSVVLQAVRLDAAVLATGVLLMVGGLLVMAAARPGILLSTRWRLETAGVWLLASAWAAYGALPLPSQSWAVAIIAAGHVSGALWRLHDIRHEERTTRAIAQRGGR